MKGVDVETKGNLSTDINTNPAKGDVECKGSLSTDMNSYSFKVDVEVPGRKMVLP